jgi:membrane protein
MKILKLSYELFKETLDGWTAVNGTLLAAALAYYATFSLAPLLVITITVAGMFFGEAAVTGALMEQLNELLGPEVAQALENIINTVGRNPSGDLAAIISLIVMMVGASLLFVQLKRAINFLWGIAPQPGQRLIITIRSHLLSFAMVLVMGLLLVAAMGLGTLLIFLGHMINILPEAIQELLPSINIGLIFVIFALFFAVLFKILPDAHITWGDVFLGAVVTALLFTIGEYLIGFYLSRANLGNAFGAASSFILILVWVNYSMQIILIGAKFTQVYANKYGSRVRPHKRANLVIQRLLDQEEDR